MLLKSLAFRTCTRLAIAASSSAVTVASFKAGDPTPAIIGCAGIISTSTLELFRKPLPAFYLSAPSWGMLAGAKILYGMPLESLAVSAAASIGLVSAVVWVGLDPMIRGKEGLLEKHQTLVGMASAASLCGFVLIDKPVFAIPSVCSFLCVEYISVRRHLKQLDTLTAEHTDTSVLTIENKQSIVTTSLASSMVDSMFLILGCMVWS